MEGYRIIAPYLWRYRWHFAFGIGFVFLANLVSMWVPILLGWTVNLAEKRMVDVHTLGWLAIGVLAVAGVGACFRFLMRRVLIDASREMEYEFRNDFFARLQRLDPSFFDGHNTGDLMSRATNDVDAMRMLIGPAIMYAANTVFSFPMKLAAMLYLDWRLTLISMVPMLGLPPMVKYLSHQTYLLSKAQQDAFGDLSTMIQENLAGIRVVKAYRQEDAQREHFLERNEVYIQRSLELARVQAIFFPSLRLLISSGSALLLLVGGWRVMHDHLQIGTLLAFILLFSELVWPLIAAGWTINIFQRGLASLERIGMVTKAEPRVVPPAQPVPLPAASPDIRVSGLTFQYEGTDRPQLQGIDLEVPAGRTIGIVGPVGSGKSTLVHLLARLYPVERGMISVGGIDINDLSVEDVRRRIAFVFQETFLFSDTIGWNIRFGAGDDAPQEAVERVAREAAVHGDIMEAPHGYDTVLGERGVNLSGGQKQRVAIARALLRDADIVVLDDSLSAVDTHTEEAILGALKSAMQGKTTFLISHRISTVAMADEIIVIEQGRITERGSHEDLVALGGLYAMLHRKQLTERAIEEFDEVAVEGGAAS